MHHCKPSEMEATLFGFGLFYCQVAIVMGDFIHHNSKEGFGLYFRISYQRVGRDTMSKWPLMTPSVQKPA